MEYVLTTSALSKTYRKFEALKDLTMHIPKGAIYGFVGRNGAGKTTLIRVICGLQEPTSGEYAIYGISNKDRQISKSRHRMGAVVETPSIYLDMTAEDNLRQQALVLGLPSYESISEILKLVGLENTGKKKARNFSLGMKQRLGIAVALIGNPDFVVLDEPINGLDPQGIAEMREIIHRLSKERGITVIVSSHILDELAKVADAFGIINDGKLIDEFTADELNERCARHIMLKTGDVDGCRRVLAEVGISAYDLLENGDIRINEEISDTSSLIASLVGAGVPVYELATVQTTLEQYFLNCLGGGV